MLTAVLSLAFFELMLHGGHSRLKQVQAGEFFSIVLPACMRPRAARSSSISLR
jgi:hypothetical protein